MMGGWSRQMPAACPPLSQRSTPLPLVDFLGQPERPGSLLGRRIEALRAIGGGGGGYAGNEENEGGHPPKSTRKKRRDFELSDRPPVRKRLRSRRFCKSTR
jgi:hypothetical protein